MFALELILIFLLFFIPLVDTDFGWHLRYGQYFLEHHEFLKNNNLTYYLPNYYWPNSYMFYQVLVALIYKLFGLLGLSVTYGLLGILSYWLFAKIIQNRSISLILFLLIFTLSYGVFNLGFRAQFLTFIFLEFELFVLLRKPVWIYSFPILFAIWANTHGAFVLGQAILGIYFLERVTRDVKRDWGELGKLGGLILLSFITPHLNAYGTGVYQESLHHALYPLDKLIAEWVPPGLVVRGLGLVASAAMLWFSFTRPRKSIFLPFCLILFTILMFTARRNVPLWGLVAAICFAQIYKDKWFNFLKDFQLELLHKVALVGGILILLAAWVPRTLEVSTNWQSYCTGIGYRLDYPCGAVEYLKSHPETGRNVYTAYEWGGFLEWQLPQYQYFSDGRMVTWATPEGKSPYTIYLELIQAQPGWNERMLGYGTDWMLIGAGTFLDFELKQSPQGWREVYRDQTAVIYSKI